MLTITPRACQLGETINPRAERHGTERVPACDIPLDGIMLSEEELNAVLDEPYAHRSLFTDKAGHLEPNLPQVEALCLRKKLTGAAVTLLLSTTGKGKSFELTDCKLKSLKLEPLSGGATKLSMTVQTAGDHVPKLTGELTALLGQHLTVSVSGGEVEKKKGEAQQQLPINTFGEGEKPTVQ
jgi:hypothetical protein